MRFDPARHALPLAFAWWLLPTVAVLAVRPAMPVDETRYLTVAWEMWQSGDWVSLRLNGAPYGHKPPLLFWLVNLGWWAFGVGIWWPRLMLAGFALGALVLAQRLARRLAPGEEALAAMTLLITASSLYWVGFTGAVMFDLMLVFFVLLAVTGVAAASRAGGWRAWALVGLALGGGILTKGPVALLHVLPLAMLAPWWLRTPPARWRDWYGGVALAVVIAAVMALAWAVPAALAAGRDFGREIFWSQSVDRMVDTSHHRRPAWFYLPGLLLLTWPWLLWPSLWRGLASLRRGGVPGVRFALAWCIPPMVGFSAFAGKQIQYLLPLLPAMAFVAAAGLATPAALSRKAATVLAAVYLGLAVALIVFAQQPRAVEVLGAGGGLTLAVALTATGLIAAAVLVAGAPTRPPAATVAVIGTAAVVGLLGVYAGLARVYLGPRDLQPLGTLLAQAQAAGQPIVHFGKYHGQYQFVGRLKQPLEIVRDVDALYRWAEEHPDGRVIIYSYRPVTHRGGRPPLLSQPFQGRTVRVWRGADLAGVARDWSRGREDDDDE